MFPGRVGFPLISPPEFKLEGPPPLGYDQTSMKRTLPLLAAIVMPALFSTSCARTELVESPKTAFVSDAVEAKDPEIIWTSRNLARPFDYLGQVPA